MTKTVITCPGTIYAMALGRFKPKWAAWLSKTRCTPELEAEYQALRKMQQELDPQCISWERKLPNIERPPGLVPEWMKKQHQQ